MSFKEKLRSSFILHISYIFKDELDHEPKMKMSIFCALSHIFIINSFFLFFFFFGKII